MSIHVLDVDSFESFFSNLEKQALAAMKESVFQTEDFKHGICFVRIERLPGIGDVPIFAETIVPFREFYQDEEEFLEDEHSDNQSRSKGYIFGRHFSEICPEGELGSCHVSNVTAIISRESFEAAKKSGWTTWDKS
jgi:hypothetical protein